MWPSPLINSMFNEGERRLLSYPVFQLFLPLRCIFRQKNQ
jgi:hypothetical protein